MTKELDQLRLQMNRLDDQLVRQLMRRIALAKKIGVIKQKNNIPIIDRSREQVVLKRIEQQSTDSPESLIPIYRVIIRACRNVQLSNQKIVKK